MTHAVAVVPAAIGGGRGSGLARLLRRWDVGEPTGFRHLAEGLMNRNYRVDTTTGPVFLKQFLDIGSRQVGFQHRVTTMLARAGLPVPAPIPARDERLLVTTGGKRFALYPWVHGRHRAGVDLSGAECAGLGRLLGRLHERLAAVMPPIQQTLLVPTADPAHTLGLIDRLLDRLPARAERDEFDQLAERRLVERRRMLGRLAGSRPADCDTLTVGYVHGDFHPLNLLYDGAGVPAAVLDWDRLRIGPYTQELVRAATLFFGHGDDRGLDLDRVRVFVAGYREVVDLDAAQIRSAVHRLWWERVNDYWMLEWRYLRGDRSCDHLFAGAAALVEWWTARRAEVVGAFAPHPAGAESAV
jgi:homoserine kinase type II